MVPVEECDHPKLQFGSGDYYIFCQACGGRWVRTGHDRPEYGIDKDGKEVGGNPSVANQGIGSGLSGSVRIKQSN